MILPHEKQLYLRDEYLSQGNQMRSLVDSKSNEFVLFGNTDDNPR